MGEGEEDEEREEVPELTTTHLGPVSVQGEERVQLLIQHTHPPRHHTHTCGSSREERERSIR